jgi:hypothetical protein
MDKETQQSVTFLGISVLTWVAIAFLVIVAGAGFTVWYNYNIAVPIADSARHVQTCNTQYLTTQKARISNDLNAISNADVEMARNHSMEVSLKAQQKQNANDIYNALDASQCSRKQIVVDMPEMQAFFQKFPAR